MKKSLILLAMVLQLGCTKEIEVKVPKMETLPVVNSIFQTDSIIKVTLEKTKDIFFNSDSNTIENALVVLYEDDNIADTLVYQSSSYFSDIRPIIGKIYSLKIDIPEFYQVKSKDQIPEIPNLIGVSFKDSVYTNSEGSLLSQAAIVISDNPNEKNYYELILKHLYDEKEWEELFNDKPYSPINAYFDYETNDPILENEGQLAFWAFESPVFSDELFNGQTYTMHVNYGTKWVFSHSDAAPEGLIVVLRSVSKNYYDYKKSLVSNIESQYSDIWDGVVEPSTMFTNIENGYGIFAGYSQVTDTIYKENN